ncbi:sigma-70 family RNA polymerase sigma factor [Lactiplantibacillus paraplantarum]|uniref:sigma-70 family RNA polymerase sigma factor n=1 Tax=Lactiplantibacillus paraplantarum TaxID=60520 RepID=UPI0021A819B0|nr:sigma-70 family RNA polymerase sigma factor [Lactiplantibacillus paraplantarum]MCT4458205.1 sigma-70 family RNA polymerase sigma factor [Lactiplantibacillus paraplantarum]
MHADRFDNQAAFDLLAQPEHQRLLYGALKAAHVTKYHPQFEDCVTVAHLTWLAAYQNYEPELLTNLVDFRKFAFRRIKWRTVDYLRKQTLRTQSQVKLEHALPIAIDPMADQEIHWQLAALLTELLAQCRPGERIYLTEFFLEEQSVASIMHRHQVSRRTVYNWRTRLLTKAHQLYQQQARN